MSRNSQFGVVAIVLALLFGGAAVAATFFAMRAEATRKELQAARIERREMERRFAEASVRSAVDRPSIGDSLVASRPSESSPADAESALRALKSEERRALAPEALAADLRVFLASLPRDAKEAAAIATAFPNLLPIVEILTFEKGVAPQAFAMLAEFPGVGFRDVVATYRRSGAADLDIATAAGRCAGRLIAADDPLVESMLDQLLKDPSPDVRILAVAAIEHSPRRSLADARRLIAAIDDSSPEIRAAAGGAIRRKEVALAAFDEILARIERGPDAGCVDLIDALIVADPPRAISSLVRLASEGRPSVAGMLLDRSKKLEPNRPAAFALLPLHPFLARELSPIFFAEFSRHESASIDPVVDFDDALARLWKLDRDGLLLLGFSPCVTAEDAREKWAKFYESRPTTNPRSGEVLRRLVECRPFVKAAREATADDPLLEEFWRCAAIWREPEALAIAVGRLFARPKERTDIIRFLVKECGRSGQLAVERILDTRDPEAIAQWLAEVAENRGKISPATIRTICLDPSTSRETIESLVTALLAADDPMARDAVAEIVIAKKSPYSADLLPVLLSTGDDRLWPIVKEALSAESPGDRAAAVRALAPMKLGTRLREISDLARDDDPIVRLEYARILARYAEPTAQAVLLSMTRDAASFVREAASIALGKSSGPRNVAVLKDRIDDEAIDVANAALMSLVELRVFDRVPQLLEHIDHVLVGMRTRRFLEKTWRVSFATKAEWLAWWENTGKVEAAR